MKKPLLHHLHDYFFPHPRNNHRPHIFSISSIAVLALVVIVLEAGYLVQTKIVFLKTDFLASVLPGTLVALTNQDRAMIGVPSVTEDPLLSSAAQAAAVDMAAKGYFSHVSPDGKTPWYWLDQAGYRYSYAGQNLAVNFTDSENVETAWMASPTHRANIEKPQYTKVGIGVANGIYEGVETTFVVQFFATPASPKAQTKVVAVESPPIKQPTTSTQVLGSQTTVVDAVVAAVATPVKSGWFTRLLTSPLNTLVAILTALLGAIAVSFTVSIFIRGKVQHPTVIIGAVFLLLLISGAMLLSAWFAGSVQLPEGNGAASVRTTLSD